MIVLLLVLLLFLKVLSSSSSSQFIDVPELVNFSIGGDIAKSEEEACFANVESVTFSNLPKIHNFSVSGIAFPNAKNVTISSFFFILSIIIELSLLRLVFGDNVFSKCKNFVLEGWIIMKE